MAKAGVVSRMLGCGSVSAGWDVPSAHQSKDSSWAAARQEGAVCMAAPLHLAPTGIGKQLGNLADAPDVLGAVFRAAQRTSKVTRNVRWAGGGAASALAPAESRRVHATPWAPAMVGGPGRYPARVAPSPSTWRT